MSDLLKFLMDRRNDKGLMADLRCAIKPSQRFRAWPYLAQFGGIGDTYKARVVQTVAALFAYQKETAKNASEDMNMGDICFKLLTNEDNLNMEQQEKQPSIVKRFMHLLASREHQIFERVIPLVLRALRQDIPIDFERLEKDLKAWQYKREQVRESWATHFWGNKQLKEVNE